MRTADASRSPARSGGVARLAVRSLLLLAAAFGWYVTLAPNSLGGPVGVIWVSGTSMEPTMHTGDLAVVYERSSYDVGDVVAFEIPGGGTVIHRIIEVTGDGYRFQGDNREFADPWVLDEDAIIGEQVALVPRAGDVVTQLGQPPVMAASVAAMVLLWALGRRRPDETDEGEVDGDGIVHIHLPSRRVSSPDSSAVDRFRLGRRAARGGLDRQGIASRYGDMSIPG